MSTDEFQKYVQENNDENFTWEHVLFPKIENIIKITLRQMADEAIESRPNSFELYGFDFVIDD